MQLISAISLVMFVAASAWAAPSISTVISHGGSVVITGSGFGAKSPAAPLMWDDGESGTVGVAPSLTTPNAYSVNAWNEFRPSPSASEIPAAHHVRYRAAGTQHTGSTVTAPHSKSTQFIAGGHYASASSTVDRDNVAINVSASGYQDRWYAHWYYREDPAIPKNSPDSANDKFLVLEGSDVIWDSGLNRWLYFDYGIRPQTAAGETYTQVTAQPLSGLIQSGVGQSGNDTTPPWAMYGPDTMPSPINGWIAKQVEISNDQGFFYLKFDNVPAWGGSNNANWLTTYLSGGMRSITIGSFYRWSSATPAIEQAFRYFDDVYIDSTLSRVMLCNNANYSSATVCEPQIPSAWSATSITALVNQGALPDGTAYLFVFDADNVANATGYTVTLGVGTATRRATGGGTIAGSIH